MNQSSLSNTRSKSTTLILFFLLTYLSLSVQLDQCSNPGATLYDGYLDTFIYYASFNRDQSSYFKLRNPFQGLRLQSTGSVMFWARLPKLSDDGALQRGRFFECADTLTARLDNQYIRTNITVNVTLANGSATTQLAKYTLDVQQFQNSTDPLLQWNSYAFSFSGGKLRTHFNGVQIAEVAIASPFMNTNSDFCTVGNSLDFKDPFNGYMRHLVFSRDGFSSSQDLTSKIRSIVLPNDANVLAYFNFGKDFNFYETYYYNSSRNFAASNLAISYASEPEQVCYCTNSYPPILRIGKDFKLRPLDLTPLNATVDQNGITLQFWIYPLRLENGDNDSAIFSLTNYTDIVLTNKGTNLRVDLYNSSTAIAQKIVLNKYRFRLQFWTLYSIQIYSNQVILTVDGVEVDRQTHSVALPTNKDPMNLMVQQDQLTYLLQSLILYNSRSTMIFNRTFTQDQLMPAFQTQNTSEGTLIFSRNNQFCGIADLTNPSKYISGSTCVDQREYAYFNNKSTSTISTQVRSSQSTMTIEMWLKDMYQGTLNLTQVLFENADETGSVVIQVGLMGGREQNKNLKIVPFTWQQPNKYSVMNTNRTYNNWMHLSIASNGTAMRIAMYNYTSKVQDQLLLPGIIFFGANNELNTTIGSSVDGSNKFNGFIREFRLWMSARSAQDITSYRQSGIIYPYQLQNYFTLNNGQGLYKIDDSNINSNKQLGDSSVNANTAITWSNERDLILCARGQYFDGQCCQVVNLTTIDIKFAYSSTKNFIQVEIINNSTVTMNANLLNSVLGNFTVVGIGYQYEQSIATIVSQEFTQNNVRSYNVSSLLINPVIYNITLQAKLFSLYDTKVVTMQKTLSLQCPGFYLSLNSDAINPTTDSNYIVSNTSDSFIKITLNSVQNSTLCYNPTTKTAQNISINQKVWSQSVATPTLSNMWNISADNYTIIQKQGLQNLNTFNRVNVKIYYNLIYLVETFVNLTYTPLTVINPAYPNSTFMANYVQNQMIDIDLTKSYASNTSYPKINMKVQCPMELFSSIQQYNQLCVLTNGHFQLFTQNSQGLLIKYNQRYYFTFLLGIDGTSVVRNLQANITLYKDGSTRSQCPQLVYPDKFDFDKVNNQSLEVYPDPYLYCNGIYYEIQRTSWTVQDQNSSKYLSNVLNTTTPPLLSTFLYKSNVNVQNIMGGSILILIGQFSAIQAGQYAYFSTTQLWNVSVTTQVQFKKNPLQPIINIHSFNMTTLKPLGLGFLEPNITLNASSSYDPDNTTAVLNYDWKCPIDIGDVNCASMFQGPRNNSIVIGMTKRFSLGLKYNTQYTFTLVISAKDNPYKEFQSTFVTISFGLPQKDELGFDMRNTSCESLDVTGNFISQDQSLGKVIYYTKNNWIQVNFDTTVMIDNNQNVARSPCGGGNIEEQYVFYYLFDGVTAAGTVPQYLLVQKPENMTRLVSIHVKFDKYFNMPNTNRNMPYKTTVYMITKRQGSTKLYLNTQNVYLVRKFADLVPTLQQTQITMDQYNNLILNASTSFDSEDTNNRNFQYLWSCPGGISSCKNNFGPILNVTYQDRVQNSVNYAGSTYSYGLQLQNGERLSQFLQADVQITSKNDYSECVYATLSNNQLSLSNDFEGDNRTIFLEYNQTANIIATMSVTFKCDNIFVYTPSWKNALTNGKVFWTQDTANPNKITIVSDQIKNMTAGKMNTINYQQQIHMGYDANTKFQYQTYINFFPNKPDIKTKVTGSFVVVYGQDTQIRLDASKSVDPLAEGYLCRWDCPSYMGGQSCSTSCVLTLTFAQMQQYLGRNVMSYYLDQAHGLNLTIMGADGIRTVKSTQYVYLSSGIKNPFNQTGIQKCSLQLYGYENFQISQTNVLYLGCQEFENLTSLIITPQYFTNSWTVQGLQSGLDYYNASGQLFIKPYALSKLASNSLSISLNVTQVPGSVIPLYNPPQNTSNTTNGTNSTVTPSPAPSTDPVAKYNYDTSLKAQFSFRRDVMNAGGKLSFTNTATTSYTQLFSFVFEGFSSQSKSTILFQLRSYQEMYKANQIVIPLKPFLQDTIGQFYTNTYLPMATYFYIDFFDINLNYMGSREFKNQLLNNMELGTYQFSVYSKTLYGIQTKQGDSYPNNAQGKNDYERDTKRLLELTEMLSLGAVYGTLDVVYNSYANQILAYLRITFKQVIAQYDTTNIWEARQKYVIQKRVILIFYNLINRNSGIQDRVLQLLDVITSATANFDQVVLSGEDSEYMRSVVLYLQSVLNQQLVDQKITNKDNFFNKIYNISSNVYNSDIIKDQNSTQKITAYTTDRLSRIIYKITKGSTDPIAIQNALDTRERIEFISEAILDRLSISTLSVEFTKDSTSPAVGTQITINAFDANNQKVDVSFMKFQDAFFMLQFKLTPVGVNYLSNTTTSNQKYRPGCVYYEVSSNSWIETGVKVDTLDLNNGFVKCRSYHLSQFSAQYFQVYTAPDTNNNTKPNDTKPNDGGTGGNENPNTNPDEPTEPEIPIQVQTMTYYKAHTGPYVGAIVAPLIGVLTIVAIGFCFRYKGKYDNSMDVMPRKSYCTTFWAVLKIHHPLFSALFSQKNGTLALPKVYQLLSLWIYIFSIVVCTLIDLVYISKYNYNGGRVVAFGAVYWLCLSIIRPVMNKIRWGMYFQYATVENQEPRAKSFFTEAELRANTVILPQQDSQVRFIGAQDQSIFDKQFEGGSEDSEEFKDDEDFSDSSDTDNNRVQMNMERQKLPNHNDKNVKETNPESKIYHQQAAYHRKDSKSMMNQRSTVSDLNKKKFEETQINKFGTDIKLNDDEFNTKRIHKNGKQQEDFLNVVEKQDTTPVQTDQSENQNQVKVDQIKLDFKQPVDKKKSPEKQVNLSVIDLKKGDGPGFDKSHNDSSQMYDVPERKLRSVKPRKAVNDEFDQQLVVKNEHNFKGTRVLLLIGLLVLLIIEMAITFGIMKEVKDQSQLNYWIYAVLGLIVFFFIYDFIFGMIYALVFQKSPAKLDNQLIAGAILVGNPDVRARYALILELKQ